MPFSSSASIPRSERLKDDHEQEVYIKTEEGDVEVKSEPEDVDSSEDDASVFCYFVDIKFLC